MPELPEVETVARTLAPFVQGKRLMGIDVVNLGSWQGEIPAGQVCMGKPLFSKPSRRGKLLLLPFDGYDFNTPWQYGQTEILGFAFHLKMTGRVFCYPAGTPLEKHTRIVLRLDDGSLVFFDDARKFGYVRAVSRQSLETWAFWKSLGKEPLDISPAVFCACYQGKKASIKSLLLDQSLVAGIGNIYADESLFMAGIAPFAKASEINPKHLEYLHKCLCSVLEQSIRDCGSSIRDYRTAKGDVGAFQNKFNVYGRAGKTCTRCGAMLQKCTISGRSTVYCPNCQK